MKNNQKRKIDMEHRAFNPEWTNKYSFILHKNKIVCLLCHKINSVSKEYNLRRHFDSKHPNFAKLDINEKAIKDGNLLKAINAGQQCFKKMTHENMDTTKISKEIAFSRKLYTEGEFIKKYMLISVHELCPQNLDVFKNISLSRMTIQKRVNEIETFSIMNMNKNKQRLSLNDNYQYYNYQ